MRKAIGLMASLVLAACSNAGPGECGDGFCRPGESESCSTCAVDCGSCAGCGDGACASSLGESCSSCLTDCGACPASCGNGTCDGSELCSSCPSDCGACSTACTSATCSGCCDGDACLTGSSPAACGSGGWACMVCGAGFTCSGSACAVDPTSRWNIVIDDLTVSPTYYTGEAWDGLGGAPDPIIRVYVVSDTTTPSVQNGPDDVFTSTYDGTPVMTNVRASDMLTLLEFAVYDEDVTDSDFVGACLGLVDDFAFSGSSQTVECPVDAASMNSGFTLRWHVERF